MTAGPDAAAHWDEVYAGGADSRSWFQRYPAMSVQMLGAAGVGAADSLIDVGAGASLLAGVLIGQGFRDVTVLDISVTALRYARQRLGARAERVQWVTADLLTWEPPRQYRAWHDRAVFHFLTDRTGQDRYLAVLDAATGPGSAAVFGVFAPDGPEQCSGLPVARYSAAALAGRLGAGWGLVRAEREEHRTPSGRIQPFTWAALRRQPDVTHRGRP